jgi:hypothetical protein
MVARERFEALFSRVMCLIAPEDLQKVMLNDTAPAMGPELESHLSQLVEAGYRNWQSFHDKFAKNQRMIRQMPAGLSRWEDIENLLLRHAGAEPHEGITVTSFRETGGTFTAEDTPARALKLTNGICGLIGDYSGSPTGGDDGGTVKRLGLNVPEVLRVIRELAMPRQPTGAALLRWGEAAPQLRGRLGRSAILWVFLRQKIQLDQLGGANELGIELHLYSGFDSSGTPLPLNVEERESFLRNLSSFTTRIKPSPSHSGSNWTDLQAKIVADLTRPSDFEARNRIRNAVWPLFVAHIED